MSFLSLFFRKLSFSEKKNPAGTHRSRQRLLMKITKSRKLDQNGSIFDHLGWNFVQIDDFLIIKPLEIMVFPTDQNLDYDVGNWYYLIKIWIMTLATDFIWSKSGLWRWQLILSDQNLDYDVGNWSSKSSKIFNKLSTKIN